MIDFIEFKRQIKKDLNIDLFYYKEEQLHRRLNSFFIRNNITSPLEYAKTLKSSVSEKNKFLDYVTINVTEFYRNPEMYEELANTIKSSGMRRLKIWSAACSNGCEPYGLAIMLKEMGYQNFSILATDLDPTILKKAEIGVYDHADVKNLSRAIIDTYFTKQGSKLAINDDIKRYVQFKQQDLLMDSFDKNFDLVVCRNVVIYFNSEAKDMLYAKISDSISPNGLFFVGATENIHNYPTFGFNKVGSFIYEKK